MLKKIFVGLLVFGAIGAFAMSVSKLNGADKEELIAISGVGEAKATAILKERKKGKFKSFKDLQERVKGIGEAIAKNIKDDVKQKEPGKKKKDDKK